MKRYNIAAGDYTDGILEIEECPDGDWIGYVDVEELLAACKGLRRLIHCSIDFLNVAEKTEVWEQSKKAIAEVEAMK